MRSVLNRFAPLEGEGVVVCVQPRRQQAQVFASRDVRARGKLSEVLGFALSATVGDVVGEEAIALTIGPDRWLVCAPETFPLFENLCEAGARFVDVSDARVVLRVSGARAAIMLAQGCGLDFDEAAFPQGRCASGLLGQIGCLFHRLPRGAGFDLFIARSYAAPAWEWLSETAAALAFEANSEGY